MSETHEMSFLDHLEELRWRIVRSGAAWLIGSTVAFLSKRILFDGILFAPMQPDFTTYRFFCKLSNWMGLDDRLCLEEFSFVIQNITMPGQFATHILASIAAGFVLSFPYIVWEMWRFLAPGLNKKERKATRGASFWSSFLFLLGVLFGYFLVTPLSVQFLGSYSVSPLVTNQIHLNSFISTVVLVTLAAGLIFQLPIVVYFLAKMGLITPAFLKKYRRHALVLVLVLSAIITPPDISSQVLVAMPILVLYEVGIRIAKMVQKGQKDES